MIYQDKLVAYKTALENSELFSKVAVGTNFMLNQKNMPLCILVIGDITVQNWVGAKGEFSIIGLVYDNSSTLEKTKLDLMENTIAALRDANLSYGNFRCYLDNNVLSVFNLNDTLMAPYGGFRIVYSENFKLDETNSNTFPYTFPARLA